jgi:hypothetical protein
MPHETEQLRPKKTCFDLVITIEFFVALCQNTPHAENPLILNLTGMSFLPGNSDSSLLITNMEVKIKPMKAPIKRPITKVIITFSLPV